jgi:threonine dehydratase
MMNCGQTMSNDSASPLSTPEQDLPDSFPRLIDYFTAAQQIRPYISKTPLIGSKPLQRSGISRCLVKLENQQYTGSFKLRGATNKVLNLSPEEKRTGVIAVSSGNHGRAVSYTAARLGISAVIVLSEFVPENKVEAIRELGAEVIIAGKTYDQATLAAEKIQAERNLMMVHPFDDPVIIAGQGTVALEILEEFPSLDTVIIPLSGGGLAAGVAQVMKSIDPSVQTIGVSMDRGPAMHDSLQAGRVVEIVEQPTLADALAGGLGDHNRFTFELNRLYLDLTAVVSEEEIATGMKYMLENHQQVIEGGGAVGISALLFDRIPQPGKNVVVIASGGNVNPSILAKVIYGQVPY